MNDQLSLMKNEEIIDTNKKMERLLIQIKNEKIIDTIK